MTLTLFLSRGSEAASIERRVCSADAGAGRPPATACSGGVAASLAVPGLLESRVSEPALPPLRLAASSLI
jgi:hypothetical protein